MRASPLRHLIAALAVCLSALVVNVSPARADPDDPLVEPTCTGLIQIFGAEEYDGRPVFARWAVGFYLTTDSADVAGRFRIGAGSQQNMVDTEVPSFDRFRNLGLNATFYGSSLTPASPSYALAGRTEATPAGSRPVLAYTTAVGGDVESAIWSLDPLTMALEATWINPDGRPVVAQPFITQSGTLGITGSLSEFRRATGESAEAVSLALVPTGIDCLSFRLPAAVDRTPPTVLLRGVEAGSRYFASAPRATCTASDAVSGSTPCNVVFRRGHGGTQTVTATARDEAGNVGRVTRSYVVVHQVVSGAVFRNGAWDVRKGRTYTVRAQSKARPVYRSTSSSPNRLRRASTRRMTSTGHGTWAVRLLVSRRRAVPSTRYVGVQHGRHIVPLKLRIVG